MEPFTFVGVRNIKERIAIVVKLMKIKALELALACLSAVIQEEAVNIVGMGLEKSLTIFFFKIFILF